MIHTACRAALRCRGSGHVRVLHAMGARTAPRTRPRVAQCVLHVRGMADDIVLHPPPPEDETTFETPLTDSQVQVARERDYQLRLKHGALPTGDQTGAADLETYRRRLVYRSRQRGWLEVDLILGKWATEFVPTLTAEELIQYEIILNCETIDVFYYISGQKPVPPELDSPVMKKLQEYAFNHPVGKADPARYANEKKNYSN